MCRQRSTAAAGVQRRQPRRAAAQGAAVAVTAARGAHVVARGAAVAAAERARLEAEKALAVKRAQEEAENRLAECLPVTQRVALGHRKKMWRFDYLGTPRSYPQETSGPNPS